MRLMLLFVGILGLFYIIGSAMVGQFGLAVVLSYPTAWATGMSRYAAVILWTGVYIIAVFIILLIAFMLPEDTKK